MNFQEVLEKALAGSQRDIESLLQIYGPLINSNAYLNGKLDEDLRQFILLRIIQSLTNFSI